MPNLTYVLSKKFDETYIASFIGGPQQISDSGYKFTTDEITNLTSVDSFSDTTEGETSTVYFTKYFKYFTNDTWSELLPIAQITGLTFSGCDVTFELYYYRTLDGTADTPLYVNNIMINGEYALTEYDSEAILQNESDIVLLKPKDVYKIFSLTDFNVIANHNYYNIRYHFTQNAGRTYTDWEPLTTENISTIKLNPLRFAQVEYSIQNMSASPLVVYDIILIGDFQNVSANYLKTNRYGLKEDCMTILQNVTFNNSVQSTTGGIAGSSMSVNNNLYQTCLSSYQSSNDVVNEVTYNNQQNSSSLWNPYASNQIVNLANMLGNQISDMLGWNVEYHLTEPDGNGIDMYKYEYTLKNVIAYNIVKVLVPNNKFPVEQIIVNNFNLDYFDTFEIHVTKDEFKNKFGITRRPNKDDILYICEANMLYYVKHAQPVRKVMNAATYYKLILEKYEYKANIRNLDEDSRTRIEELTNNTTIDELFGAEQKLEENKIANKEQTYPTTFDKNRQTISSYVTIVKDSYVDVDNFYFIKSYYDLSNTKIKNRSAIDYKKMDSTLLKSDNRSIIMWVNFKNKYDEDAALTTVVYNNYSISTTDELALFNNYLTGSTLGYKLSYRNNKLNFKINADTYSINKQLLTNVWYAFVVNLNQRQETLDLQIYKRNTTVSIVLFHPTTYIKQEVDSTDTTTYNSLIAQGYKPVTNEESLLPTDLELVTGSTFTINPYEFEHSSGITLYGSNIYCSNIRILDEIIESDNITNILKEEILRDEQHIILSDNATKSLFSKTYLNKNWK